MCFESSFDLWRIRLSDYSLRSCAASPPPKPSAMGGALRRVKVVPLGFLLRCKVAALGSGVGR
jgi:hypothetical protein